MGSYIVVEIGEDDERRIALPAYTGRKNIVYDVTLHVFHLAHMPHLEDAEADVNGVIEAVKDQIRSDVTLGGICYQAGESRRGIRSRVEPSIVSSEISGTEILITFQAEVMIVA